MCEHKVRVKCMCEHKVGVKCMCEHKVINVRGNK